MTLLLDEIAVATIRLAESGIDSPRTDAEVIAAHVHGVSRTELHLVADRQFDPRFWNEVARREAREPLQHITGLAGFRYLEVEVGPGVFVPRPETEVMTGWAVAALRAMDVAEPVVADLGTGSGAIALANAQEVPREDGLVAVEHGAQQGAAVYWIFAEERGWRDTRNHKDLAGRDRFVTTRR